MNTDDAAAHQVTSGGSGAGSGGGMAGEEGLLDALSRALCDGALPGELDEFSREDCRAADQHLLAVAAQVVVGALAARLALACAQARVRRRSAMRAEFSQHGHIASTFRTLHLTPLPQVADRHRHVPERGDIGQGRRRRHGGFAEFNIVAELNPVMPLWVYNARFTSL